MKRQQPAPAPPELLIVKQAQTNKLSTRSSGQLSYQIGYLPDQSDIFVQLCSNEGGGYFSREWIPASRIQVKLDELRTTGIFSATALKSLFVGRSSNNASFLAALLKAEELILTAPESETRLIVGTDIELWITQTLTLEGTLTRTAPEVIVDHSEATKLKNKTHKRSNKSTSTEASIVDSKEGANDASNQEPV